MPTLKPTHRWPLLLLLAATLATARDNPVDPLSNPHNLAFPDVEVRHRDLQPPFLRDGVVVQPAGFRQIVAGLPSVRARELLGAPLRESQGPRGPQWHYDFKFALPASGHFMVCQYTVVFDAAAQAVRETAWRRRQCEALVAQGSGAAAR